MPFPSFRALLCGLSLLGASSAFAQALHTVQLQELTWT